MTIYNFANDFYWTIFWKLRISTEAVKKYYEFCICRCPVLHVIRQRYAEIRNAWAGVSKVSHLPISTAVYNLYSYWELTSPPTLVYKGSWFLFPVCFVYKRLVRRAESNESAIMIRICKNLPKYQPNHRRRKNVLLIHTFKSRFN